MRSTPESTVLRACMEYLRLAGIAHWRINQGGVPLHDGSGGFRPGPSRGVSDIIGIGRVAMQYVTVDNIGPVPLAIECKSAKGKQSPAQRDFEREWRKAGGVYIVARSADELRTRLRAEGIGAP